MKASGKVWQYISEVSIGILEVLRVMKQPSL